MLRFCIVALLLVLPASVYSQTVKYVQAAGTSVTVKGTSTLHDWHMTSAKATILASFSETSQQPSQLHSLTFSVPVVSLLSGKSALDKNAWEALNYKQHSAINLTLASPTPLVAQGTTGYKITLAGSLVIAGTTKKVSIPVSCVRKADGTLVCTGSLKLKMTDYGVKPPVLMLGTLKTGDDVTIEFNVSLKPQG